MKCPNCGMNMSKKGYCMYCGYMNNGVVIDTKKAEHATSLELYFGEHYDKYTRNQNWFISGILGPTYLLCHKQYFVGLLLILFDTFLSLFVITINTALMATSFNIVYWFINRVLWATINNMIYIKLTERKLIHYQEKHPEDFDASVQELYKNTERFTVLKYVCFGLLFMIIYWFLQNILYYYVSFI